MEYTFSITDIPEQKALFISETVQHDDIGNAFMRNLTQVYGYATTSSAQPAGPPFGRYLEWRERDTDMEIGVIVANDVPSHEKVQSGSFGGFKAVVTTHVGSYDGLQEAHDACHQWITAEGLQMSGPPCELYTMDPHGEPDSSKWTTDVIWPIL